MKIGFPKFITLLFVVLASVAVANEQKPGVRGADRGLQTPPAVEIDGLLGALLGALGDAIGGDVEKITDAITPTDPPTISPNVVEQDVFFGTSTVSSPFLNALVMAFMEAINLLLAPLFLLAKLFGL